MATIFRRHKLYIVDGTTRFITSTQYKSRKITYFHLIKAEKYTYLVIILDEKYH